MSSAFISKLRRVLFPSIEGGENRDPLQVTDSLANIKESDSRYQKKRNGQREKSSRQTDKRKLRQRLVLSEQTNKIPGNQRFAKSTKPKEKGADTFVRTRAGRKRTKPTSLKATEALGVLGGLVSSTSEKEENPDELVTLGRGNDVQESVLMNLNNIAVANRATPLEVVDCLGSLPAYATRDKCQSSGNPRNRKGILGRKGALQKTYCDSLLVVPQNESSSSNYPAKKTIKNEKISNGIFKEMDSLGSLLTEPKPKKEKKKISNRKGNNRSMRSKRKEDNTLANARQTRSSSSRRVEVSKGKDSVTTKERLISELPQIAKNPSFVATTESGAIEGWAKKWVSFQPSRDSKMRHNTARISTSGNRRMEANLNDTSSKYLAVLNEPSSSETPQKPSKRIDFKQTPEKMKAQAENMRSSTKEALASLTSSMKHTDCLGASHDGHSLVSSITDAGCVGASSEGHSLASLMTDANCLGASSDCQEFDLQNIDLSSEVNVNTSIQKESTKGGVSKVSCSSEGNYGHSDVETSSKVDQTFATSQNRSVVETYTRSSGEVKVTENEKTVDSNDLRETSPFLTGNVDNKRCELETSNRIQDMNSQDNGQRHSFDIKRRSISLVNSNTVPVCADKNDRLGSQVLDVDVAITSPIQQNRPGSRVLDIEVVSPSFWVARTIADEENGLRRSCRRRVKTDRLMISWEGSEHGKDTPDEANKMIQGSTEKIAKKLPTRSRPKKATFRSKEKKKRAKPRKSRGKKMKALRKDVSSRSSSETGVSKEKLEGSKTDAQMDVNVGCPESFTSNSRTATTKVVEAKKRYSIQDELGELSPWTSAQVNELKMAQAQVDPTSSTFWLDVEKLVEGKTASECRDKWFSLVKTPMLRKKKSSKSKDEKMEAERIALLEADADDDIFNSTPLRGVSNTAGTMSDNITFDVGSPIIDDSSGANRVVCEYDEPIAMKPIRPRAGYKTYLQDMRRCVSKATKEKKHAKEPKVGNVSTYRPLQERVGEGGLQFNAKLSPGGTLLVNVPNEDDDDQVLFRSDSGSDSVSEGSDCDYNC